MPDVTQTTQPPANFPKQAVVVIHGMGEQTPMDTIKGFVEAVWEKDDEVTINGMDKPNEVWSKPDLRSGSLELRRITTRQSTKSRTFKDGVRTDFYELYWADLSAGSTLDDLENWLFGLLWRNPNLNVPPQLKSAWYLLWFVTAFLLYLVLAASVKPDTICLGSYSLCIYAWTKYAGTLAGPIVAGVAAYIINRKVLPYVGRVVRYTRATPDNIAARKDIRERGLALLTALHDGSYERIIIVGHSLGSILGYDLISYFWASRPGSHTFALSDPNFDVLRKIEAATANLAEKPSTQTLAEFEEARRIFAKTLRKRPVPQPGKEDTRRLITDFITLGSPLTHCEFLLNSDHLNFQEHKASRQAPTAPPVREVLDPKNLVRARAVNFQLPYQPQPTPQAAGNLEAVVPKSQKPALMSFPFFLQLAPDAVEEFWQLHHAAPFAAVRWTNIYDPAQHVFQGDIVSGPLAALDGHELYGPAINDINLRDLQGQSKSFSHLKYWSLEGTSADITPVPLTQLRKALDLSGARDI